MSSLWATDTMGTSYRWDDDVAYQTPLTVREALERVNRRRLVLPAIQREFVWASDPERMAKLFDSLLRRYPIGTFLFWEVPAQQASSFDFYEFMREWHERDARHNPRLHVASPQDITAVLDGQQRLTTLNIGLHGSVAHRARYKRPGSPDAYPRKYLYLDLLFEPQEDDDIRYRFEFRTPEQASDDSAAHWYRVAHILDVPDAGVSLFRYVNAAGISDRERPFETLSRLWDAVHRDGVISYFEEQGEELSRVLDIFVRVNSGGVVLSKSDLLLSMATAHFQSIDARDAIHHVVDELNETGSGFNFSKDLVLKAGLVLTGISDIGFRVENFTTSNMRHLEENWGRLTDALRLGVHLLSSFGFSGATLPAASVLIPVADYIYQRGLTATYVDSEAPVYRADRSALRSWLIRTILMPGVWGSALDGLLRGLHRVITETSGPFPVSEIEREMARRGKSLTFDDTLIADLLDTQYKHPRAFGLLTLLYDTVETTSRFHIDHVFPRSLATPTKLRAAGLSGDDVATTRDHVERLPNLQLLRGPVNLEKRGQLPLAWFSARYPLAQAREATLAENDLVGLPADFDGFLRFYEARRELMRSRLTALLRGGHAEAAPVNDGHSWSERLPSAPGGGADSVPGARLTSTPRSVEEPEGPPHGSGGAREQRPAHPRQARPYRTRRVWSERLEDLVADARLQPNQVLTARYLGRTWHCTVEPDGALRYDGRRYREPSTAAMEITGGVPVNGWEFWFTAEGRSIGSLRRY